MIPVLLGVILAHSDQLGMCDQYGFRLEQLIHLLNLLEQLIQPLITQILGRDFQEERLYSYFGILLAFSHYSFLFLFLL